MKVEKGLFVRKKKKIKTIPPLFACQNSIFVTESSQDFCSCGTLTGHSGVAKVSFSVFLSVN